MKKTRKPRNTKIGLGMALDKYYAQQVEKGEIEAVSDNRMEITGKPFASYVMFLGLTQHWGKILRKITGKTVFVTASYFDIDKQTVKHETRQFLTQRDFMESLR